MAQYIDKSALVAEIERMLKEEYPCDNSEQTTGYHCALYELQDFLNSLEVKEVEEKFECPNIKIKEAVEASSRMKYIDEDVEYTRTDVFIEKACGWLRENKNKYVYNWGERGGYFPTCSNLLIRDFKKYMKGE